MSGLHLDSLSALDPARVPLPHGTTVITRVDRALAGRVVPEGAVGRVVATHEDGLDVAIVGAGTLRYRRDELVPKKLGEARWAVTREAAYSALAPCAVLEATVGSRAWGLAHEASDTDLRGVFALPFAWTATLVTPPDTLVSADATRTLWEVEKALKNALRADPNTLEMLFVPTARALDPVGELLLEAKDAFVSSAIYGSFGRYALSQLASMNRSLRLAKHRELLFGWLREEPTPSVDELARRLSGLGPGGPDALRHAKEHIKQLYRSLHDRGLLGDNDFASLVTFVRENKPEGDLDVARDLKPKNAYNLVRLIATAVRWLETGRAELEVKEPLHATLLAIKRGEVSLDETLALAERMAPDLERARRATKLPPFPDYARANDVLLRAREAIARRHVERAPGPFGVDAPPLPAVGPPASSS